MVWVIIAAVFAAAAYVIYRNRKEEKAGGNYSDHRPKGKNQER
jgi:tryptophan-rich sensory protein